MCIASVTKGYTSWKILHYVGSFWNVDGKRYRAKPKSYLADIRQDLLIYQPTYLPTYLPPLPPTALLSQLGTPASNCSSSI